MMMNIKIPLKSLYIYIYIYIYIENQLKNKYPNISNDIIVKLYLYDKKQNHPERIRFNPFVLDGSEFDEFINKIMEHHKQNPDKSYTYQCMVNAGHSAMVEIRIIDGKKTAIFIDAAGDLRSTEKHYIPTLIKNGFKIKIFVSDFDRKMLEPEGRHNNDGDELFSPTKLLASRKYMFAPINFFRRVDEISLQNDMYACQKFALSYMVQSGKDDFLKEFNWPSLRIRVFLKRKKMEILKDAYKVHGKTLNPFQISILPFSSLPDRFIKTAHSGRILRSRPKLNEKYDGKPGASLASLDKKTRNLGSMFTTEGLIYAVLPAVGYLRLREQVDDKSMDRSVTTSSGSDSHTRPS